MSYTKTLRDEFAMAAMVTIGQGPNATLPGSWEEGAEWCYKWADTMLAERAKNATQDNDDGWIEWNGGECPVPDNTEVQIRYFDGDIDKDIAYRYRWNWMCGGREGGDIIAYRIVK